MGRRLPQAAPGCPYEGGSPLRSPRSLTGSAGPLYRGIEAWKGRSGPRSDLHGERRAETGGSWPVIPAQAHADDALLSIDQT